MVENWGLSECVLEEPERFLAVGGSIPFNALAHKPGEQDRHIGIVSNEMTVEIGKTKEGLYVFNLPRGRPIPDDLNFRFVHFETVRADNEA